MGFPLILSILMYDHFTLAHARGVIIIINFIFKACHATNGPPYRRSPRTTYVAIGSPPGLLVLPQVVPLGQLVSW